MRLQLLFDLITCFRHSPTTKFLCIFHSVQPTKPRADFLTTSFSAGGINFHAPIHLNILDFQWLISYLWLYTCFPVGKQHFLFKQLNTRASNSCLIILYMRSLSKYELRRKDRYIFSSFHMYCEGKYMSTPYLPLPRIIVQAISSSRTIRE